MFTDRIKDLRINRGLNKRQLSELLGLPYTTYNNYETGTREPNSEVLKKMANFFNVSIDYLLGNISDSSLRLGEGNPPPGFIALPEVKSVPLLGTIACGTPIIAQENIEEYIRMDKSIPADFALRCKGDSMINARIFDGDIVFIRQQPDVESGEIAAVLIENEATLKRVIKYTDKLVLRPENPMYSDLVYSGEELADIRIIGKAVAFLSTVK